MRPVSNALLSAALLALSACSLTPASSDAGTTKSDGGTATVADGGDTTTSSDAGDTTTTTDGGNTPAEFVKTTIAEAVANGDACNTPNRPPVCFRAIEVSNVVVVAEHHYTGSTGVTGTFYVQDGNGPGLAVFKKGSDVAEFPSVGDTVNVKGHFSEYSGIFEISSSTRYSHPLTIEIVSKGSGRVPGGAMPPAGAPYAVAAPAEFAHDSATPHPELRGHVVQFNGPLTITNTRALVTTDTDGGTKPTGFEVSGGVRVNDSHVYYDCIKSLDGGVGALDLSNGIRGVWDRYQDFNGGTSQNPAPTVPVLYPMNCADLNPTP
jgi:hypothetical protein